MDTPGRYAHDVQEIVVSAEDDAEVRRISLTNTGSQVREVDLTSYSEIVLASQLNDMAHPAFSKLFVRTEYLANEGAILATRRRRSENEPEVWAAHLSVMDGEGSGKVEIETDRARFLGRGGSIRTPRRHSMGGPFGHDGYRTRSDLRDAPPCSCRSRCDDTGRLLDNRCIVSRIIAGLVDKHRDITSFERASTLAWTQAQVQLRHIG